MHQNKIELKSIKYIFLVLVFGFVTVSINAQSQDVGKKKQKTEKNKSGNSQVKKDVDKGWDATTDYFKGEGKEEKKRKTRIKRMTIKNSATIIL